MRILVATDAHIFKTPDGKHWSKVIYSYDFWTRYLNVFDCVRIVARVKDIPFKEDGMSLVDGEGVEVFAIPFFQGPKQLVMNYSKIRKCLKNVQNDCDVALLRMPSPTAQLTWRALKSDIPLAGEIVFDPTDALLESRGIMKVINMITSKQLEKFCRTANGVSYVTANAIQENYPSTAKLEGESPEYFESSYSTIALSDSSYVKPRDYTNNEKFVLTLSDVAMNTERKGERTLIEVVKLCRDKGHDVRALIIGDGSMRKEFEEYSNQLYVSDYIDFIGLLPNSQAVQAVLLTADIYVFPTFAEGLPRGIIEAMALGMPVISTPVGGIPELISSEYLFNPTDAIAISDKLCQLIDNRDELNRMSATNFNRALDFHNETLQLKRDQFYRRLKELALD